MSFGIVIRGADTVEKDLAALTDTTRVKQAVLAGALMIESTAKELIQHSSPSGRTYTHGSVTHVASAPGQPPATDTGQLVSSIQHWESDDGLTIAVGTNLETAKYLEYGTTKMQPRPFMNPAVDMNRAEIVANIKAALVVSK